VLLRCRTDRCHGQQVLVAPGGWLLVPV
jgi:hypothetical protein